MDKDTEMEKFLFYQTSANNSTMSKPTGEQKGDERKLYSTLYSRGANSCNESQLDNKQSQTRYSSVNQSNSGGQQNSGLNYGGYPGSSVNLNQRKTTQTFEHSNRQNEFVNTDNFKRMIDANVNNIDNERYGNKTYSHLPNASFDHSVSRSKSPSGFDQPKQTTIFQMNNSQRKEPNEQPNDQQNYQQNYQQPQSKLFNYQKTSELKDDRQIGQSQIASNYENRSFQSNQRDKEIENLPNKTMQQNQKQPHQPQQQQRQHQQPDDSYSQFKENSFDKIHQGMGSVNLDKQDIPHSKPIYDQPKRPEILESKFEPKSSSEQKLADFLANDNKRFVKEQKKKLSKLATRNVPEYNILLLGETGAGKSTTINALANYLKYDNFDIASSSNFSELISSKFMLTNPNTGDDFVINSGVDQNECHDQTGVSSTQDPMAYQFHYGDKMIRIIDTPGMGDTRGLVVDQKNFDKILEYLQNYKQLHAICILIKANETRQTASFRYCITELLTQLHKNACKNIVFCFTFGRNTFYGPGDGFVTLKNFLAQDLPEVNLQLRNGANCFFVDNEAYRFLVAKKCKFPFLPNQDRSYKESWDKSSTQTKAIISQILNLTPHNLEETFELNKAKKLIMALAQPMVNLQQTINSNIKKIQQGKRRFESSLSNMRDMEQALSIEVNGLELRKLEHPVTVCTSAKCIDIVRLKGSGENKVRYKTRCHEQCYEINISNNAIGHPLLKNCKMLGGKCKRCGCSWQKHMRQTTEFVNVKRDLVDAQKLDQIVNQTKNIDKINMVSKAMEELVTEYQGELNQIQNLSGVYGYLLEKYSNTSFNRFLEPFLDLLIDEEDKKISIIPDYSKDNLNSLIELKKTQLNRIQYIKDNIASGELEDLELKNVDSICDNLVNLRHSGHNFKQIVDTHKRSVKERSENDERLGIDFTEK